MKGELKNRVLLIDNDTAFCEQFNIACRNKYILTFINKKEDVVSTIMNITFDLILLDLYLTHENTKNGFELIQVIRDSNLQVPIVVITKDANKKIFFEAHVKYKIKAVILKQQGSFEEWAKTIDRIIVENPVS